MHGDAVALELRDDLPPELVVPDCGEQRARTGQPRQLHGGDRASTGGLAPRLARVDDLAPLRNVVDSHELDPLDMPDDCDVHRRQSHI